MGITFVGFSTSATSTAAIPTEAEPGDFLIAFAVRDNADNVAPTLASSWTSIQNGGGNNIGQRTAYRFWDGTFSGPSWTNATGVIMLAYRGVDRATPIGVSAEGGASTANITPGSAGTFTRQNGTSWGLSVYAHTTPAALSPGFGTERVDFAEAECQIGAADSSGGVNSWAGGTVTHSGVSGNRWASLEIMAAPAWNPNYPEVVGMEWWPNVRHPSRVWTGSPGRMQRLTSTRTETITALKLSATIDPLLNADTFTLVDIFEEGQEVNLPAFKAKECVATADNTIGNWTTGTLATTNLFAAINEGATRWPGPTQNDWIQVLSSTQTYRCSVNTGDFDTGQSLQNARIGFVEVRGIFGANTGFRKIRSGIEINGTQYAPAGGTLRDVHGYGAMYTLWYGELNPATEKPWTPAEIADFASGGTNYVYVKSEAATSTNYPKIYSLSLFVYYVTTDNRVAVGVYRRPETLDVGQVDAQTDSLLTVPGNTSNWAKVGNKNYLLYWRQSVCPSLYGPVNADDVIWNGAYQDLGPRGIPGGRVYPLTASDEEPDTGLASRSVGYDQFGRPQPVEPESTLALTSQAAYGVAPMAGTTPSVDSQPYRTDLDSLVPVKLNSATPAQRFTPTSNHPYLGIRYTVVPPATSEGNFTASVHRVSDGVQMGGSFVTTASAVRARASAPNGWRYVSGFLSAPATLTSGIQYEVRFTAATTGTWYLLAPDGALAPSTTFGGTTDSYVSAGVADTDRDLCVVLTKQPDPPTGQGVVITTLPVSEPSGVSHNVQHVTVSWTAPAVALGAQFSRYEVERLTTGETDYQLIANIRNSSVLSFVDHLAPRGRQSTYRIRAVGKNGQFSDWATTSGITPQHNNAEYDIILTSNHDPSLEVVLRQARTASFTFRNNDTNEVVQIYGADYQVVFTELEERGVTWSFEAEVSFGGTLAAGFAGRRVFDDLRAITDSKGAIPFVGVMDYAGDKVLAHVTVTNAAQTHIGDMYTVTLEITPTFGEEEPPDVT